MTISTERPGEVEVPHLKERLWQELAQLHAEQRAGGARAVVGDVTATDVTATDIARRRARRSLRLGVAAAAAAFVLVAAVGVQLAGRGGPSDDELLVERVAAATEDAIEASVVHVSDLQQPLDGSPARRSETWYDEETGIARLVLHDDQGAPRLEAGPLVAPTLADPTWSGQRVVIHCSQDYIDHVDTGGASTEYPVGVIDIRDLLAGGTVVEDGTEQLEGRTLIRLRGDDFVILADPGTYRVVAQRGTSDTGETYTSTFEYIPRSDASLGSLVPAIPTGYTLRPAGDADDDCLDLPGT